MPHSERNRKIDVNAAVALIQWKHIFSSNLLSEASRISDSSESRGCITPEHCQKALAAALEVTAREILATIRDFADGKRVA